MPASKDRIFEVAKRVTEAAKSITPKGEFETATINAVAITLFWRAISLYEAILILAKREHVEEALILARSLFEDSLIVHEISAADNNRAALVVKWLNNSIAEKEALMKEAQRLEFPGDQAAVLRELARQRQQVQVFAKKHSVVRPKTFPGHSGTRTDFWSYGPLVIGS